MVSKAIPCERGCGTRTAGGIYLEVGQDERGRPLEDFIFCPPFKLGEEAQHALGITPVGVTLIEREGAFHVFDWVGEQYYPNVVDWLEETRFFGVSRRLPSHLDFGKLSPKSRLFVIHPRAWLDNAHAYYFALPFLHPDGNPYIHGGAIPCPKGIGAHNKPTDPPIMCAQVFWTDIEGGEPWVDGGGDWQGRKVRRNMPSFTYLGFKRPAKVEPRYTPAVFASFPISRLVVIRDSVGGKHNANASRASAAKGIPVELEDN